jgi:hypothetical protein
MRRRSAEHAAANGAAPSVSPIAPTLDLRPDAVYLPSQVIAALGLRASSLRSEWRAGRLRVVRRCGKNYLLGKDLLAWLNGGELPSPAHRRDSASAN